MDGVNAPAHPGPRAWQAPSACRALLASNQGSLLPAREPGAGGARNVCISFSVVVSGSVEGRGEFQATVELLSLVLENLAKIILSRESPIC